MSLLRFKAAINNYEAKKRNKKMHETFQLNQFIMYQTFGKCIIILDRHGRIITVKCTHYLLFSVSYMSVTATLFLTHFLIY